MIFFIFFPSDTTLASTAMFAQLFNAINESIRKEINRFNLIPLSGETGQITSTFTQRHQKCHLKLYCSQCNEIKTLKK